MAPFRLRHPKGVSTIQLDDTESATVQDLLHAISSASGILPSAQDRALTNSFFCPSHTLTYYVVKVGYPPRSLTAVIPELPLSSLGLAPGDQLIVVQKSGSAASPGVTSSAPSLPVDPRIVDAPASLPTLSSNPGRAASSAGNGGPDYVEVNGGYLVHRVRVAF